MASTSTCGVPADRAFFARAFVMFAVCSVHAASENGLITICGGSKSCNTTEQRKEVSIGDSI